MTSTNGPDDSADAFVGALSGGPTAELTATERAELAELQALLADPTLWSEPPAELEDRVVASIAAEAQNHSPTTDLDEAQHAIGPDPIDLAGRRQARHAAAERRAWWQRPGVLTSAAAAVVAVAVGTVLVIRSIGPNPSYDVALTGTDLLPGATAGATMTRTDSGWDIELDAPGLPRLDGGQFYQAWLRNADGVLVPIGSFNEGTTVTLWSGVSPADFPILTVTRESADGNQDSSGQRVLTGEARPR